MKSNIRSARKAPETPLALMAYSALLFGFLLSSCSTNKKITYFQDIPDSLYISSHNLPVNSFKDPVIQPNDILQITILTLDPEANNILTSANSASFSVQPGSSNNPAAAQPITGFLVDRNGFIELPVVGKIKLAGLTTADARDSIHDLVGRFYKGPVVNVRFTNYSITVLGEVARPATYVVPNEKLSIMDAIGIAGDLTIYGKRENVLLVRDSAGQKQFVRFNLNSSATFSSPYFYLKQGDMIYVEPNKSRITSSDATTNRNITLAASGISVLIILLSRL
ncbi:MAG: polysaccharide biosynthesis/export family protein [Chitinophagaceae bacterium]|nr:polysaccharide biosynthesis/export family protein [Chitinophagaceae bacterium]